MVWDRVAVNNLLLGFGRSVFETYGNIGGETETN